MAADTNILQQDLVYAGLDAILATLPLDLCAYLHAAVDGGPQLYMRRPDLAAMDPSDAFDLFTALRHTLDAGRDVDAIITIGGFNALAVTTQGAVSAGLHVVGRRGGALSDEEQRVASGLCRSLGTASNALDAAMHGDDDSARDVVPVATPLRITVSIEGAEPEVEVTLALGSDVLVGRASDPSPAAAVVLAVLDAVGHDAQLTRAGEGRIGDELVLVVELTDGRGRRAFGVSERGKDPLQSSAQATLDAVARLGSTPVESGGPRELSSAARSLVFRNRPTRASA
jgi:hypothetical protein